MVVPTLQRHAVGYMADCLLGRDARLRKHVLFVCAAVYFYAVCIGVNLHAMQLGVVPQRAGLMINGALATMWPTLYLAVRSGLTRRLADPSLTFLHGAVGVTVNAVAYVLLGPTRGNALFLMALALVLVMFRLKPWQIVFVAALGVVEGSAAIAWLRLNEPESFTSAVAWAHFGLLISCLPTIGWVGAMVSSIRLRLGNQRRELRTALGQVEQLATRDALTGLVNRGHMQARVENAAKQTAQTGIPLSVALLDVDLFKSVNDSYGHRVGDEVLKSLAKTASQHLRAADVIARWGGEEFLLLLPGTSVDEACLVAESVRDALAAQRLVPGLPDLMVTLSAGVAQIGDGEPVQSAIERADRALYQAKERGRNCCVKAQLHLERVGSGSAHPGHPIYAA